MRCAQRILGLASLLLLCLLLVLSPHECGSVLLVYNTGQHPPATTRFEDEPAQKGFGPRVPEEVRRVVVVLLYFLVNPLPRK